MAKRTDEVNVAAVDPEVVGPVYGSTEAATPAMGEPMTGAEWLEQAKECEAVLVRGDHVSPARIKELFLQSVPVIEGAMGGSGEPGATRRGKKTGAEEKDERGGG